MLFAQLVDDPSEYVDELLGDPDCRRRVETELEKRLKEHAEKKRSAEDDAEQDKEPPTLDEVAADVERQRLFGVIEMLVLWKEPDNVDRNALARREIAQSLARGLGVSPPEGKAEVDAFLIEKLPPVVDPFCGGGSIPLEAQRLGLRARGSDLNPVAVLITKALVEIPPRFADLPPVNEEAREKFGRGAVWNGKGAQGLAEDVRYYGQWIRDQAEKRIGHLYPKVRLPDRSEATVIAWLWARTVASPNPAARGAHVPLTSSFVLSSKKDKEAILVPVVERGDYHFTVKSGGISREELTRAKAGTKNGRGANFTCLLTGAPIAGDYIKAEGMAGRMGARLMAVVAVGQGRRVYLEPTEEMERVARAAGPEWRPEGDVPRKLTGGTCYGYGLTTFADLFTDRQLVALGTFSDLVGEARERVLADALSAGIDAHAPRLAEGGSGAQAYADAVATYLGFALSKATTRNCTLAIWESGMDRLAGAFGRQALPMQWAFAETNPLAGAGGDIAGTAKSVSEVLGELRCSLHGSAGLADAALGLNIASRPIVSTDPPYYDNIAYADLSDFFYVWLRRSVGSIHPDLFRTLLTPKAKELVATPYRFGGNREDARKFFETGLGLATANMRAAQAPAYPMTLFYAYKQAEAGAYDGGNGIAVSTGWETMLSGLVTSGFLISGTWPVRSEATTALKKNVNALASSIVIACRPRPEDAPMTTRRDFTAALKRELPRAIRKLQRENIAPVDLAQAAIGPGMAVFSRYAQVLEADGTAMGVRQALIEINRVLDETLAEAEGDLDADTRFCVAWFEQYGTAERAYGEAEVMFTAKNTSFAGLERAGVVVGGGGKIRLKRREELDPDWDPATDMRIADWECVQHLVRAMTAETGGGLREAARLAEAMGPSRASNARFLAYRLYTVAERKGWTEEALACNILVTSWPQIRQKMDRRGQGELVLE